MIINTNLASLNTTRQLGINEKNTQNSLAKLSSGFRINSAADDAAGLSISEKMRGQIRGLNQASANSQDGISMVSTAEGALNETTSILQRMRELAVQAGSDTNTTDDRTAMQTELNALTSEINRIGNTTEFNTQKLLNGGGVESATTGSTITRGGTVGATAGTFNLITSSVKEVKGVYSLTLATATLPAAGDTITINGQNFTAVAGAADASKGQFSIAGATQASTADSLAAAINQNSSLHAQFGNVVAAAGVITLTEQTGQATGVAMTSSITSAAGTLVQGGAGGSIKEVQGVYGISVDKPFEIAGQTLTIGGTPLTAVAANADATAGQFNISSDKVQQAADIAKAINGTAALSALYSATAKNGTITLTEKATTATGTSLNAGNFVDGASAAVPGKYDISFPALVNNNGKVTVDGVDIAVTSDEGNAGLANGTAMLAGTTLTQQSQNLANAINSNAVLNTKYTATVNGDKLELVQKTGKEAIDAPVVTSNTSATAGFNCIFQIGANTGQTMSVQLDDMRSVALGISGTKASAALIAKNGAQASLLATKEASDGSTNNKTEYTLDISTAAKATAAISIIDDATSKVSAERSNLGAYENRLQHTINNLGTSSQNITSAEARIRDVDMAQEMTNFQKNNILQQAANAMLAQANQQGQGVLQLLR